MPGGLFEADTSFPNLEGKSTEEKLRAIESYLYQLLETLRYTLNNISQDNMNTQEVTGWLGEIITEPIQAEIGTIETGMTQLGVDVSGIKAQVTDGQGNYTVLNLKSDGLHVGNASGTTTIDGGNITANSITLDNLGSDVTGSFGDANPAYIKNTYIDFRQVSSPKVYAGDFYGGKYHDSDGDSTLDITSTGSNGVYKLLFGDHSMTSESNANFAIVDDYINVLHSLWLKGAQIVYYAALANGNAAFVFPAPTIITIPIVANGASYGSSTDRTNLSGGWSANDKAANTGRVFFQI